MLRTSTGVKGLDEMLGGGFPSGRVILISGGPGTGKTIFALQFLMAAIRGEAGVYVTMEEPLELIVENVKALGWDIKKMEASNLLGLLDLHTASYDAESMERIDRKGGSAMNSISDEIGTKLDEMNAKNLVIDPITSVTIHERSAGMKRGRIAELFNKLRKIGCTAIITSEITSKGDFYMEEFLADGVIRLDKCVQDFKLLKTITIDKMRGVKYDEQPRRYEINEHGFSVYNTEPVIQ